MPFAKAKTALAALEDKLRRSLGLAGEIRAEFIPNLTPVVITGDLREAGNASFIGRAWAIAINANGGAGTVFSISPQVDAYIDEITVSVDTANLVDFWLTVGAGAIATTTLGGTWTDRKTQTAPADQVPILQANLYGALTGLGPLVTNRIWSGRVGNGTNYVIHPNLMMPAGTFLNWALGTAVVNGVTVKGRVWP